MGPPRATAVGSEWIVPLVALVALFAAFVLVQAGTLFGGAEFVRRTAGLTYAAYAREGFAQLLTVALLTLGVVAAVSRAAAPRDERDARLRRGLLAALCALTLVVLASSFHRLALYEAAFGFTRARVTAHATIIWLGVVFVLVLALGASRRTAYLPRAAVVWTGLALLTFAALRPDAIVARANLDHHGAAEELDLGVLGGLSDDAVPVLIDRLPADVAACLVGPAADDDPLTWNVARARADAARATLPPEGCGWNGYGAWR